MIPDPRRQLGEFVQYKEDINNNLSIPLTIENQIGQLLMDNGYHLSRERKNSKFFIKGWVYYRMLVNRDLVVLAPGYSYLEVKSASVFHEQHDAMERARFLMQLHQPKHYSLAGAALGLLGAVMPIISDGFSHDWLALPAVGGILGRYAGGRLCPKLQQQQGQAIQCFWREIKGIKTGWSALEEGLR